MNQYVASFAVLHNGVVGLGISGDHDRAIRSLKPIAVRLRPVSVVNGEGLHDYVLFSVDYASFNLMYFHFASGLVGALFALSSNLDVGRVRSQDAFDHILNS